MWKKKAKECPKIKVHKLEIEKLKLESALAAQKKQGIACAVLLLFVLLFFFITWL